MAQNTISILSAERMLYLLILTVLSKSFELRCPVDNLEIERGVETQEFR